MSRVNGGIKLTKKLFYQGFALLAPPVLFVVWILSGKGVRWIASKATNFQGSTFSANTILMALVWLGHLMTLINLSFYIHHVWKEAFKPDGTDLEKSNLSRVFWLSILLFSSIFLFVVFTACAFFGIKFPFITFERIIIGNHYFLLFIFFAFMCMDWLAIKSAKRQVTGPVIEEIAAWLSVWLISVPSIIVTALALLLHWGLVSNPDWMLVIDKPEILSGEKYGYLYPPLVSPSSQEKPLFELFVSGLNIGLIMSSIIVSQIAFFVIEILRESGWSKIRKEAPVQSEQSES